MKKHRHKSNHKQWQARTERLHMEHWQPS